ncbi:MAG: bifunctional folylpolyglutamate synthase/dihydrofolate synthase [Saprospiraceae bacterium]|nr:bifunctional folylpolyglutamate synthase/dihydrofolate synthase [Saprospiraceae bacterium]MDW8484387.1 folylpolyglutamate synthase/dihydrofolate synthase family protein [Saprospiraceae bacterium]
MKYAETLRYLYDRLPMFQRIGPAAYKKDLTNIQALCAHLGEPHKRFASLHVGGTNGKGSVSHFLAALCQLAGLKTGLHISPHYKDFRERIKINGCYIPRNQVVAFVTRNRQAIEAISPSFFELSVAMAFDYFARQKVDIAVVEVGLGGRLDSTNILTPLLSIITNIGYDHQNILGHTLELIAGEKAGIIKPGVPVVIGETHPESAPVFQRKAEETGSPLIFADQVYQVIEVSSDWNNTVYDVYRHGQLFIPRLKVDVAGPFQTRNLATALQAWEVFCENSAKLWGASPTAWSIERLCASADGFFFPARQLTRFIGRWQIIGHRPTILCDSAHNEPALQLLWKHLSNVPPERLHVVFGMVSDKDAAPLLACLPSAARYYFAKANIPRGLDAELLRERAAAFGLRGKAYRSVRQALGAAKRAAAPEDLIVVTGSIFVVAEVL